jgi:hypothetical protein
LKNFGNFSVNFYILRVVKTLFLAGSSPLPPPPFSPRIDRARKKRGMFSASRWPPSRPLSSNVAVFKS